MHLLEELPPAQGPLENLGPTDLQLQDREPIAKAGPAVLSGQRQRQLVQPTIQAAQKVGRGQPIADALQGGRVGAAAEPVIQRGGADAALGQLALGPFVAVHAELHRVGRVATDLQKAGPHSGSMK